MTRATCLWITDLLHGYHWSLNEFAVTSDGEVPRADPHQIVEGEFQDETTIGTNLQNITNLNLTYRSCAQMGNKPFLNFVKAIMTIGVSKCPYWCHELCCERNYPNLSCEGVQKPQTKEQQSHSKVSRANCMLIRGADNFSNSTAGHRWIQSGQWRR